jgi:hypothetical protein
MGQQRSGWPLGLRSVYTVFAAAAGQQYLELSGCVEACELGQQFWLVVVTHV